MDSVIDGADSYFRRLLDLLLGLQITDEYGKVIALNQGIGRAVELIIDTLEANGKAMVMGNGGSAAIASHLHNDLSNAVGLRCLIFHEPSLLTAIANDHGYSCVFENPVRMWAEDRDLFLAISSSGQSENILQGVNAARVKGCRGITMTGFRLDNPLRRLGTLNFYIDANSYGLVEVAHAALAHYITDSAMLLARQRGSHNHAPVLFRGQ